MSNEIIVRLYRGKLIPKKYWESENPDGSGKMLPLEGWKYGYLTKQGDRYLILDGTNYEVDEKTIGQSTGKKDDDGIEIFEGDIVEVSRGYCGNSKINPQSRQCVVGYSCRFASYEFNSFSGDIFSIKIIGNIHDEEQS